MVFANEENPVPVRVIERCTDVGVINRRSRTVFDVDTGAAGHVVSEI
jgi:hypothetical protein